MHASTISTIDALILCGGLGKRLASVTGGGQKVLVEINETPFISILIEHLSKAGFRRFILASGHEAATLEERLRKSAGAGIELVFSREESRLGTAGAVLFAREHLISECFFVFNGDTLCDLDCEAMLALHRRREAEATIALVNAGPEYEGGFVKLGADGAIESFSEKKPLDGHGKINAGAYIFNRSVLDRIPSGREVSLEREIFPSMRGAIFGFDSGGRFIDIGTPARLEAFRLERKTGTRAARFVLLDRDGVIFSYRPNTYVNAVEDIEYVPGALEALKLFREHGFTVIVISNQAGVGKGLMSRESLDAITARMIADVAKAGGEIGDVFYCVHNVNENCDCRKPRPGMILEAAEKHGFDPRSTYFVGDNESDIAAGKNAGCRTILVLSGNAALKSANPATAAEFVERDLFSSAQRIVAER